MNLMIKPIKQGKILKNFNKFPIFNDHSKYINKIERTFCNSKNQKSLISKENFKTANFSSGDFGRLRLDGNYIDKSLLIQDFMKHKNVLITRPRRWGKTSGLSTLKHFFQAGINKQNLPDFENNESKVLFTGGKFKGKNLSPLKISNIEKEDEDGKIEKGYYIKNFQGKYPVIFVSFKRIDEKNEMLYKIGEAISTSFQQHEYLLDYLEEKKSKESLESNIKIKIILTLKNKENKKSRSLQGDIDKLTNYLGNSKLTKEKISFSLQRLSKLLKEQYNKRVILLIDEYNAPFNSSVGKKYFPKVVDLMRDIVTNVAKNNDDNVERCLFVGITRIINADIFSGLNNFSTYTVLDGEFIEHFGFTKGEVEGLIDKYLGNRVYDNVRESFKNSVKHWYNGYNFGNKRIYNKALEKFHKRMYNPWSISRMIKEIQLKKQKYGEDVKLDLENYLEQYWIDTSQVDVLVLNCFSHIEDSDSIKLLSGESIEIKELNEKFISFKDFVINKEYIYPLLVHTGYLTREIHKTNFYKIPNFEVLKHF